ncbi:MAG TPA: gluconate 2-dehydrogenase subunit 3 family protein [Sphingobacteriaceae bacterium]
MHITRRIALRNLLIAAAGTALLPSCLQDDAPASVAFKKIRVTGKQEQMLASLTETIIPTTDTPGAREISAHLFLLKMVDDCYTADEQREFLKGLEAFSGESEKRYRKDFHKLDAGRKEEFLSGLEKAGEDGSPLTAFYRSVRSLTILGYTTSEYYLTRIRGYRIIPGKYQGSVPVAESSTPNASHS